MEAWVAPDYQTDFPNPVSESTADTPTPIPSDSDNLIISQDNSSYANAVLNIAATPVTIATAYVTAEPTILPTTQPTYTPTPTPKPTKSPTAKPTSKPTPSPSPTIVTATPTPTPTLSFSPIPTPKPIPPPPPAPCWSGIFRILFRSICLPSPPPPRPIPPPVCFGWPWNLFLWPPCFTSPPPRPNPNPLPVPMPTATNITDPTSTPMPLPTESTTPKPPPIGESSPSPSPAPDELKCQTKPNKLEDSICFIVDIKGEDTEWEDALEFLPIHRGLLYFYVNQTRTDVLPIQSLKKQMTRDENGNWYVEFRAKNLTRYKQFNSGTYCAEIEFTYKQNSKPTQVGYRAARYVSFSNNESINSQAGLFNFKYGQGTKRVTGVSFYEPGSASNYCPAKLPR